jgi:hypothetical protein
LAVLTFIEEATKALQQRGIPLAKAQGYLDILSKRIQKGRVEQKPWAKSCLLQTQYIGMERRKLVSKAFHHGVIKLQEDQAHDLTPEDKEALASLRIDKEENLEEVDISDTEVEETTIQEDYEIRCLYESWVHCWQCCGDRESVVRRRIEYKQETLQEYSYEFRGFVVPKN